MSEKGFIPCTPEQMAECKWADTRKGCYEDVHHEYWPRKEYKTKVEKAFRGLVMNQTVMCRSLHDEEHAGPPPEKPTRDEMLEVINDAR